jgi:hypothetical protein
MKWIIFAIFSGAITLILARIFPGLLHTFQVASLSVPYAFLLFVGLAWFAHRTVKGGK